MSGKVTETPVSAVLLFKGLLLACCPSPVAKGVAVGNTRSIIHRTQPPKLDHDGASQRSLHNAPIFRLLLKVAVKGTHQCDFLNFCGALGPQHFSQFGHDRTRQRRIAGWVGGQLSKCQEVTHSQSLQFSSSPPTVLACAPVAPVRDQRHGHRRPPSRQQQETPGKESALLSCLFGGGQPHPCGRGNSAISDA